MVVPGWHPGVAWFNPRSGHAELLRNAEGYEKTPSVAFYDKEKNEVLVGSAAEFMLDDEETSRDVKVGIKHDIGTATLGSREGHMPHLLNKLATRFDFLHDVNFGSQRYGKLCYRDADWTSTHDDGLVASR